MSSINEIISLPYGWLGSGCLEFTSHFTFTHERSTHAGYPLLGRIYVFPSIFSYYSWSGHNVSCRVKLDSSKNSFCGNQLCYCKRVADGTNFFALGKSLHNKWWFLLFCVPFVTFNESWGDIIRIPPKKLDFHKWITTTKWLSPILGQNPLPPSTTLSEKIYPFLPRNQIESIKDNIFCSSPSFNYRGVAKMITRFPLQRPPLPCSSRIDIQKNSPGLNVDSFIPGNILRIYSF